MQIHDLKRKTPHRKARQVGRGGKRGKTSGRGTKGQKARAGHKMRPEFRDQIKKLPKLRGYRFRSFQTKPVVINLAVLEEAFATGTELTPTLLVEKKLVSKQRGKVPAVKILGTGNLSKALHLSGFTYSASTKAKVEAAGGSAK